MLDHPDVPKIKDFTKQDQEFASKMKMLLTSDQVLVMNKGHPDKVEESALSSDDLKQQWAQEAELVYEREVRPADRPAGKDRDAKKMVVKDEEVKVVELKFRDVKLVTDGLYWIPYAGLVPNDNRQCTWPHLGLKFFFPKSKVCRVVSMYNCIHCFI